MPEPKDVVIAIVGASAALGGLVLVFLGIVLASVQAYGGATPASVLAKQKAPVPWVVGVFFLSIVSVGLGFAWLAAPGGATLYHVNVWIFVTLLVAIAILAGVMSYRACSD